MAHSKVGELAPDFDEQRVVEAAKQGDQIALTQLYDHYFPRVYRYVSTRLSSTEDAEDVTTEIFLRIIENLRSFAWRGLPFGAWVFRIARNEVVSHVRRTKVRSATAQLTEMIQEDLVAERIAIDSYREMITYFGNDDPTSRRMLEEILAVEEEHADDLVSLLEKMG